MPPSITAEQPTFDDLVSFTQSNQSNVIIDILISPRSRFYQDSFLRYSEIRICDVLIITYLLRITCHEVPIA